MAYQLQTTPTFEKAFKRLESSTARHVTEKLRWLSQHPEALRHPLHHLPADLQGLQKYRVGDWRLLFWVDHTTRRITLYTVEHRSRIYRQL